MSPRANAVANFSSDTQTLPSRAMRESALDAALGDEQKGEDPTTTELCRRVAELLGKEVAVFMPTGTMCNEVAINIHCRPGEAIVCHATAHITLFEKGGPAAISGAMIHALDGDGGRFTAEQVAAAIGPRDDLHMSETGVVSVEQTANMAGGAIWPPDELDAVAKAAHDAGVATHMDGARLLNACVATGVAAADYARGYDSVWLDFTKGLGCPMGAVLAGSAAFVARARQVRQMLGGGPRQPGFVAAPCLYALDHNVERLAEDNALAADIGFAVARLAQVTRVLPVDSNIVIFDLAADGPTADDVVARLDAQDVRVGALDTRRIRAVTHLDVGPADAERLMAALGDVLD